MTRFSEDCGVNAVELINNNVRMPLSSVEIDILAVLDKIGAQSNPTDRLQRLTEQIIPLELRKQAINLMFPLLEKFRMPIKLD